MSSGLKQAEYESLREEILAHIRQRFDVMVVLITASTLIWIVAAANLLLVAILSRHALRRFRSARRPSPESPHPCQTTTRRDLTVWATLLLAALAL